jgi:soluble lytic murein transglycosylase-like protein
MSRRRLGALACLAVYGLSCGPLFGPLEAAREAPAGPELRELGAARGCAEAPDRGRDPHVAAVAEYLAGRNTGLIREEIDELAGTLVREARQRGVDLALVMAVMHVESRFHNFALSPAGALGLMQILPSTGEELAEKAGIPWLGSRTLLDPSTNVRLGIAYLRELSDRYDGDLWAALAAYNWGPGHVDRRLEAGAELPSDYPSLVWQARAQRAIARVSFTPTSSARNRSIPLIAASAEPR